MSTLFSNANKYEVIARNESDNEWKFRVQHNTFIGMLSCLLGVRKYDNVYIFIRNKKHIRRS